MLTEIEFMMASDEVVNLWLISQQFVVIYEKGQKVGLGVARAFLVWFCFGFFPFVF